MAHPDPAATRTRLAVLLLAAVAVALALSFGLCIQDDTWISFRYAEHLVQGHGLVYNPGERVEGYTNFLWTLLIAGFMAPGLDPVLPTVLASVAAFAALVPLAGWLAGSLAGQAGERPARATAEVALPALVAAALVATDASAALEAVQGLESALYAALVALAVGARLREERRPGPPWSGLACGLAALTRPEGLLVAALVEGLPLLAADPRPLRARLRARLPAVALIALFAGGHLAFRLAWYGSPVPNTFHAKVGWTSAQLLRGLAYLGEYAAAHLVLLALALIGAVRALRRAPRHASTLLLLGLPAAYLAYVAVVGGDFKPTWRFVLPVLAPLAALAAHGALALGRRTGRPALVAALAVLAAVGVDQARLYPRMAANAAERLQDLEDGRLMGTWLAAHVPADTVLAIHAAGIVPYHSRLPTIDMWGLSDPHIARRRTEGMGSGVAGHEKTDYAYVFGRQPDLYVPHQGYVSDEPVQLLVPADFPAGFEQAYTQYSIRVDGGRVLNLYARSDRPLPWAR